MGHSQAEKAASRERILSEAADQIRGQGLDSLSVAKLMASAGLTHGGFYGHFASRAELVAEALQRALSKGAAQARAAEVPDRLRSFRDLVRSYVSRAHRDAPQNGCAIAALAGDVGRADEEARGVLAAGVDGLVASAQRALGEGADEADAMLAVSAMVGAVTLARVYADLRRSDALLKAVRERLPALLQRG